MFRPRNLLFLSVSLFFLSSSSSSRLRSRSKGPNDKREHCLPRSMASQEESIGVISTSRKLYDFTDFYKESDYQYEEALEEIKNGHKESHWIWYIFPQLALHGFSSQAQHFGLKSLPEAVAYLNDEKLGPRLIEITSVARDQLKYGRPIKILMGSSVDSLKLLSCATLFYFASQQESTPEVQALFTEFLDLCRQGVGKSDVDTERFCSCALKNAVVSDSETTSKDTAATA